MAEMAITTLSPLGAARLRRRLTVEEAAARAGMGIDEVKSLEENRMYRFGSSANALAAALVYATALGISQREAREMAGLPVASGFLRTSRRRRAAALTVFVVMSLMLGWFVARPQLAPSGESPPLATPQAHAEPLLPHWEIQVDVYNGTGVGNAAAGLANEVAGLAYRIGAVQDARRKDYLETLVYYPPGAEGIAHRLARELGIGVTALPGGDDPRRLVVVVGRKR
jgi:LytR cell envelope-related transcriptional attenuator